MPTVRGRASQEDWEGVTGEVGRQGEKPGQCDATEPMGRSCFIEEVSS